MHSDNENASKEGAANALRVPPAGARPRCALRTLSGVRAGAAARLAFTVLVAAGPATGCISVHTHSPVAEGTQLSVTDASTGEPVQDVAVFSHATVKALGWGHFGMAEACWTDVFCRYEGHRENPISVPRRKYRVLLYNFLFWGKSNSWCRPAVILYKPGYFTTVWTPKEPTEVKLVRINGPGIKPRTGEGQIDGLLYWSSHLDLLPHWRYRGWTGADALLKGVVRGRGGIRVRGKSAYKRIVRFAIDEYGALLGNAAADDETRARLRKKVAGLSRMIAGR